MRAQALQIEAPYVFDYVDARTFVRDYVDFLKSHREGFSFRKFTKEIGMASPGHIHLLISGRASLTAKAAEKLARGFELSKVDAKAFLDLVMLDQTTDANVKENLRDKILSEKMRRKKAKLKEHQFAYLTHWYYPVIRELVGLADFKLDLPWIASRLRGDVPTQEISKALKTLFALGMIRTEGSALVQSEPTVLTEDLTPTSDLVDQFHKAMMMKAHEAQSSVEDCLREISGMTLTLDAKEFNRLKQELVEFRNQVFQRYGLVKPSHDRVYQVNLQFFPLTK
jgi:uncharacterized protein (TIGR02147 family)